MTLRDQIMRKPIPYRRNRRPCDASFLFEAAFGFDEKIFERPAEETLRGCHPLGLRDLSQLRPEGAQDFLMRQFRAADQPVHLDRLGKPSSDMVRQLTEKTA